MMNRKAVVLAALLLSGVALACTIIPSVVYPGVVQVSSSDSFTDKWDKIANALNSAFGSTHQNAEVISVRVPVKTCVLGVCGASIDTQFMKACGQTFKQAAQAIGQSYAGGGSGGGGGVPPTDPPPGGGWQDCFPGSQEVTGCTSAGGGAQHCTSIDIPVLVCPGGIG